MKSAYSESDLTPIELSFHLNRNSQCELWAKIRNIDLKRYKKPLQWEVFKDSKWVGTWGTGNDSINIGPSNEEDNTVDQRLANPAVLPIEPFSLHKWKIKLLPDLAEVNKINNFN